MYYRTWLWGAYDSCKRALSKRLCSAQETYDFKEPTYRRHPIAMSYSTFGIELTVWNTKCTIGHGYGVPTTVAKETYHFTEPTNRSHAIAIQSND